MLPPSEPSPVNPIQPNKRLRKILKPFRKSLVYLSAQGKLWGMGTAGAFTARYLNRIVYNDKDKELTDAWAVTLGVFLVVGIYGTNYFTRHRNMVRNGLRDLEKEEQGEKLTRFLKASECECLVPYDAREAGWFSPDHHQSHPPLYVSSQIACAINLLTSTTTPLLFTYEFAGLIAALMQTQLNLECGPAPSSVALRAIIFSIAALISYAQPDAFLTYNLPRIRAYYHTFIFHQKWREISVSTYLQGTIGVLVGTIGHFFSTRQALKLLPTYTLCNVGINELPDAFNETYLWLTAIDFFIVMCMMSIPAIHNQKNHNARDVNSLLQQLPRFFRVNLLILLLFLIDCVNTLISNFLGGYQLPQTLLNRDLEADTSSQGIVMMVLGVMMGSLAFYCLWSLDNEAYRWELEATLADQTQVSALNQPLITEENENVVNLSENNFFTKNKSTTEKNPTPYLVTGSESILVPISLSFDKIPSREYEKLTL